MCMCVPEGIYVYYVCEFCARGWWWWGQKRTRDHLELELHVSVSFNECAGNGTRLLH
jgi:hypothetical protein